MQMSATASGRHIAVSFIIDSDPVFAFTGWNLAHSLAERGRISWSDIHVQFTPEVPSATVALFKELGCTTHRLTRFGDGRYCNKLAQWENVKASDADHYVFLDTDMICLDDFSHLLPADAVAGKIVDLDNPRLPLLDTLFERAGFTDRPEIVRAEARNAPTYRANCNGGLYSVPRRFADTLFEIWRDHALRLLKDIEPLRAAKKESHVDQVAFCMAIHELKLPFEDLHSNANYYLHFAGEHVWRAASRPLAMIHYHNGSLNVVGLLQPAGAVEAFERDAVQDANALIRKYFNTRLFWDFRYKRFPERGSGVGSRGSNLNYKRELLVREGAEQAASVLDVGCGDLEVVRSLNFRHYVGIDRSATSLELASAARPDWTFVHGYSDVPAADLVLCFEVAIHQESADDYFGLVKFITAKTARTLIVSGYDDPSEKIDNNHMLYFYEPLRVTLEKSAKFSSIRRIGEHSSVVVYRCDV